MGLDDIKYLVERETGLDLSLQSRRRHLVYARFIFFKLARTHTSHSLDDIGRFINKDHASVLHGVKQFENVIREYEDDLYKIYIKIDTICRTKRKLRDRDISPEYYYKKKYRDVLLELLEVRRAYKNQTGEHFKYAQEKEGRD